MCACTDLWEPWAGNRPGPPGRHFGVLFAEMAISEPSSEKAARSGKGAGECWKRKGFRHQYDAHLLLFSHQRQPQ
jgi:hypothetical protein